MPTAGLSPCAPWHHDPVAFGLILPIQNARRAAVGVRGKGAKMLDGYIVREQERAAVHWRASCASDDALRRQIQTLCSGVFFQAHQACYKSWREESVASRTATQ